MDTILTIPANVEVTETPTSTYWFDEDGILCSITKKHNQVTLEETKRLVEDLKLKTKGRKFCMLGDVTYSNPTDKASREYIASELPKLIIAVAMVSKSPVGRMLANVFFALKPPPYPVKMFSNEKEAKQWLKQYLYKTAA